MFDGGLQEYPSGQPQERRIQHQEICSNSPCSSLTFLCKAVLKARGSPGFRARATGLLAWPAIKLACSRLLWPHCGSGTDLRSVTRSFFCVQSNFSLAMKLLKELHREARTRDDWLARWVQSYCQLSHSRARAQRPSEQLCTVLRTVSLLGGYMRWALRGN